jgi:hypothetical protein
MHKIGVSTARSPELLSAPSKANNNNSRAIAMREISYRAPRHTSRPVEIGAQLPTSTRFGMNTFGIRQLRAKLPTVVYKKLAASIRLGKKLDSGIVRDVTRLAGARVDGGSTARRLRSAPPASIVCRK